MTNTALLNLFWIVVTLYLALCVVFPSLAPGNVSSRWKRVMCGVGAVVGAAYLIRTFWI